MMNSKLQMAVVIIVLMSGCATPATLREKNGDFIRNIAVATQVTAAIRG